ncbi:unnamed protein product [Lathyrus oleraceus]
MYDDALLQVWIAGCVVFVLMTESAMEGSWFVLDLKACCRWLMEGWNCWSCGVHCIFAAGL